MNIFKNLFHKSEITANPLDNSVLSFHYAEEIVYFLRKPTNEEFICWLVCYEDRPLQGSPQHSKAPYLLVFTKEHKAYEFMKQRRQLFTVEPLSIVGICSDGILKQLTEIPALDSRYSPPPYGILLNFSYNTSSSDVSISPQLAKKCNASKICQTLGLPETKVSSDFQSELLSSLEFLASRQGFKSNLVHPDRWAVYIGDSLSIGENIDDQLKEIGISPYFGELVFSKRLEEFLKKSYSREIFTPIPQSATIDFDLYIEWLINGNDYGYINFGIVNNNSKNSRAGKYLTFYYDWNSYKGAPQEIRAGKAPGDDKIVIQNVNELRKFKVSISVSEKQVVFYVNHEPIGDPIAISFNERLFEVGYTIGHSDGCSVEAKVSNLVINAA